MRKVQEAYFKSLAFAAVMWLAIATGCQAVTLTPVPPPATAGMETCPTATTSPTVTHPPAVLPDSKDVPIVLVGTLIDGTGAEPLENAAILIQDGVIAAVGAREEVEFPPGAYILELKDATILPGFINAHVHSTYEAVYLETWVQAGVTTVRDLGARYPFFQFSTRDRLNEHPEYATLISAGPIITAPGGYPMAGNNFPCMVISNPNQARREIARLIEMGAEVIKIALDSGDGLPVFSLATATAIVETAHQYDVPVAAHIGTTSDLRLAVAAGVDDFSHVLPIPDDLIEQLVLNEVYWVPTLETSGGYDGGALRRFVAAGGQVALGNDSGLLDGMEMGMPMREIGMMQTAGMTPMEIIVAATRNAAHVCNREDTLGTLEVGKIADILVVRGDPLSNLQALKNVLLVIHQGVIVNDATQK